MNEWKKNRLRRKGYSEVAIWELEHHQNIELNRNYKKEKNNEN